MQRVKEKRTQNEGYVEDVVDSETESGTSDPAAAAQPLLPIKVFAPPHHREETVPLTSQTVEDEEEQMVTIINENIKESALNEQVIDSNLENIPGNIYTDVPISLVLANNKDPFIEDIPTPAHSAEKEQAQDPLSVEKQEPISEEPEREELEEVEIIPQTEDPVDTVETEEAVVQENGGAPQPGSLENAWASPDPAEHPYNEAYELDQLNPQEAEAEPHEEAIYEETQINSEGEGTPVEREPDIDEYGNLLDENGHPIIKHAFPKDWILQPDEGDGIMRFETEDGPVRFMMEMGYNFPDPPNDYSGLQMDCYLKHVPTTHLLSSGCQFFVDNGIWKLELDVDVVNALLRMDIAEEFEDLTGETFWDNSEDITIENIKRAMTIFKDCVLDETPNRLFLERDAHYNPKDNTFLLSVGCDIENVTKDVRIADGMTLVESKITVDIPRDHNTEFKNENTFLIYEDSTLEEQGIRHLDSDGCNLAHTQNTHLNSDGCNVVEPVNLHVHYEDSLLEDQGTRHLLCEEGDMVDIVRGHELNDDAVIEDIARSFVIVDDSDKVDIKRHRNSEGCSIDRTPVNWEKSNFENELVDITELRLETDIELIISPSRFNLNQLNIDDEYLGDGEEEEEG